MPVRPCPVTTDCPDRPFGNLSAEEPDPIDWFGFSWQSDPPTPPFGQDWTATACNQIFTSKVSQADADLQALIAAILCNLQQENPTRTGFAFNQAQQCCVPCGDGTQFCWNVAAGIMPGLNVAQANLFAHNAACLLARRYRICLSNLVPNTGRVGTPFSASVTASGTGLISPTTWSIVSGSLPGGLTLGGFSPNIDVTAGGTETIKGTPITAGTFTFTLRATGEDGTFMQKVYTITIAANIAVSGYWNLNEAPGNVDRGDSTGNAHTLNAGGITEPGVAALISNGVEFSGAFGGGSYSSAGALSHVAGDSFSVWGWIRVNSTGPAAGVGGPLFEYFMVFGSFIYISGGSSLDPKAFRVSTFNDDSFFTLTLNQFHFFHLFYDATVQKFGYSIDNGAETLLPTAQVLANSGGLVLLQQHYVGGTGVTIFDELGIVTNHKLTSAQITYLYNGGVGRTWPIVIP